MLAAARRVLADQGGFPLEKDRGGGYVPVGESVHECENANESDDEEWVVDQLRLLQLLQQLLGHPSSPCVQDVGALLLIGRRQKRNFQVPAWPSDAQHGHALSYDYRRSAVAATVRVPQDGVGGVGMQPEVLL